jgi:hypothetical protein
MIDQKLGSLSPIVYFENARGEIVLPPSASEARLFYEGVRDASGKTYRDWGFEWREADSLAKVDDLQNRLVEQDRRQAEGAAERDERRFAAGWARVRDNLYSRMISSSTSEYEKEFIRLYLELREDKRARHRQRWLERTSYLWCREMDASTLPQDRMKG